MASGQKMRKMDSLRGPPVKTERGLRAAWRHPALRTIHLWQLRPEASRRCWLSATCCCAGASMLVVSKTKVPKFQRSSLAWCLGPCFCRQLLASHALRVHLLLPASLRPDCQHLTPHCRTEQPGAPGMPSSARAKDERHQTPGACLTPQSIRGPALACDAAFVAFTISLEQPAKHEASRT